jgi:hypothetical protein
MRREGTKFRFRFPARYIAHFFMFCTSFHASSLLMHTGRYAFPCSTFSSHSSHYKTQDIIIYIRSLSSHHSTLVKHLHKIAPTGEIAHRNNHHYSSKCPSCDCENETNDHVLLCPAASRKQWRQTSRAKLILYIDQTLSSDPVLCDILRDGVLRWESHLPSPDPSSYPALYRPLIISQNQIGWDHLFRARWSRQWQHLHRSYAQRASLSEKHSDGLSWVRKIGQKMLHSWLDLWKLRNQERHGADQREQKEKRIPFIRSQSEELYSFRDATMPTDRHMFHTDVDAHFARHPNLDHLEDWRPAIMSSVKQARDLQALDAM